MTHTDPTHAHPTYAHPTRAHLIAGGRTALGALGVVLALALALAATTMHAEAQVQPQKSVLTVYTYSAFTGKYGPGAAVKARFEAECACTLEWVSTESAGSLMGRLKLESGTSRADVVLGLDVTMVADAAASGLFQPHGLTPEGLSVPGGWNHPLFLPFDHGHLGFIHDTTKLTAPPTSLRDLVENADGPRIILQDPRTSAPGFGFVLWMRKVYGDGADAAWARLQPRIVTFAKGWSESYSLFLKGEGDMVLSYLTSPAYHMIAEKKDQYQAAPFAEGHFQVMELAGMTRSARNPELARRFLSFMLSDSFQSLIPQGHWMLPVREPASGLPEAFRRLHRPDVTLSFTPEEIATNRRAWIDGWLNATSR